MRADLATILAQRHVRPGLVDLLPRGTSCYLVGGALRNWLAGRPIHDFDFAFPDDPTALAREFARRHGGTWFALDAGRDQSRVVVPGDQGVVTFDFAPLRARNLIEDLHRRDFTVNAMALELVAEGETRWHDPLGGEADLARSVLKACSPEVMRADPLRILKGLRHAAHLGLEFDPDTWQRMQAAAPKIADTAPERIRAELGRMLQGAYLIKELPKLFDLGLVDLLRGPGEVSSKVEACCRIIERIEGLVSRLAKTRWGPSVQATLQETMEADYDRRTLLRLSGLWRVLTPGRSKDLGDCLRFSRRTAAVLGSVEELPTGRWRELDRLASRDRSRALWAVTLGTDPVVALILLAAIQTDSALQAAERIAPVLGAYLGLVGRHGRVPDLLEGGAIQELLGLEPGPAIGEAQAALRRAEMTGTVTSVPDAKRYLLAQTSKRH